MAASNDQQDEPELSGADEEFARMREMLHEQVSEFAVLHDLPVGAISPLLLDLAVTFRMMDYVVSVAKPSGSGLKLDLDRLRRQIDDFVRNCKRHADEFIESSKHALEEADAQEARAAKGE